MAFSGHAPTHGASRQDLQVIAVLNIWRILIDRMRDLSGLKIFSFSKEQAYSHMSHPTHFSLSQLTCWLTMFNAIVECAVWASWAKCGWSWRQVWVCTVLQLPGVNPKLAKAWRTRSGVNSPISSKPNWFFRNRHASLSVECFPQDKDLTLQSR